MSQYSSKETRSVSNTSRRFVLVEAMLLLAPVTVLTALGRGAVVPLLHLWWLRNSVSG